MLVETDEKASKLSLVTENFGSGRLDVGTYGGIYLIRLNISTFGHTFWVSFFPCSLNVENAGLYKPLTYFL